MAIIEKFTEQVIAENIDFETFAREYADKGIELVGGKVIKMSPELDKHNFLVKFILAMLDTYVVNTNSGVVFHQSFLMKTFPEKYGRQPDVMVVTNEHMERYKSTFVDGAADLVVEVVSPESVDRDRGEKFREYETIGVREYWIIDPIRKENLFYVLEAGDEGQYFRPNSPDEHGVYHSAVLPRLKFRPAILLAMPIPTVPDAVRLVDEMLAE